MSFDWTKVEGYREDLTAEEKLSLLENMDTDPNPQPDPEPDPEPTPSKAPSREGMISKAQFDKVSKELAAAKRQLRAKMSADEIEDERRRQEQEDMKLELETLRKEKTVSNHKASFLSQGYDEALADEAANAMADGDMETVFAVMRKHSVNAEKALRAKILKETPVPPAGDDPNEAKAKKEMADLRASFGLPPI